jgi:hypothetical protein
MSTPGKYDTANQVPRSSWQIIKRQAKLLLFPLVWGAAIFVIALFYMPWFLEYMATIAAARATHADDLWSYALTVMLQPSNVFCWVVCHVLAMHISTFVNVAFYHEVFHVLEGEPASLRGGLQFARQRLPSIIRWSLFACSVGIVLRLLGSRMRWAARLATALAGLTWSVVAVFVIPEIIRDEKAGPLALLHGSALTLRKTWGEPLKGFVEINLLVWFLGLALIELFRYGTPTWPMSQALHLKTMLICLLCGAATYIVNGLYGCALYVYATEGVVPEPFTPELMDAAWKIKKN